MKKVVFAAVLAVLAIGCSKDDSKKGSGEAGLGKPQGPVTFNIAECPVMNGEWERVISANERESKKISMVATGGGFNFDDSGVKFTINGKSNPIKDDQTGEQFEYVGWCQGQALFIEISKNQTVAMKQMYKFESEAGANAIRIKIEMSHNEHQGVDDGVWFKK